MQIALAGFMGVGKSTVGRLLATELSRSFVDTDEVAQLRIGRSIVECFQAGDEAIFREAEAEAVREALTGPPSVIALGGGATLREDTRALLLAKALLVYLHGDDVRGLAFAQAGDAGFVHVDVAHQLGQVGHLDHAGGAAAGHGEHLTRVGQHVDDGSLVDRAG